MDTQKLTDSESARHAELRARYEARKLAWQKYATPGRSGGMSANAEQSAQIDSVAPFSNAERSELGRLDFRANPPAREFVYPSSDLKSLTDFMGNKLMTISCVCHEYVSAFGDKRRSVRAVGINGAKYCGKIYGTYARMTPAKL